MTDIDGCGGGGWTLVMNLDGTKVYFTLALVKKISFARRSDAIVVRPFLDLFKK